MTATKIIKSPQTPQHRSGAGSGFLAEIRGASAMALYTPPLRTATTVSHATFPAVTGRSGMADCSRGSERISQRRTWHMHGTGSRGRGFLRQQELESTVP